MTHTKDSARLNTLSRPAVLLNNPVFVAACATELTAPIPLIVRVKITWSLVLERVCLERELTGWGIGEATEEADGKAANGVAG